MQKPSKRKLRPQQTPVNRSKSSKASYVVEEQDPFPSHPRPTPQDCRAVRDSLLSFHGFPPQFAHYRKQRLHHNESALRTQNDDYDSGGDSESVLDGLVKALLSQNTTEVNSLGAFSNLKSAFPTWEDALAADKKHIENAIKCGGLAPTKASYIKNILTSLLERKGKLCLEYLRDLSTIEIKAELSHFKGIGPKTVACVLMFNLQRDDFPVDTHVYEIAKSLGWVPYVADRNKTYIHLNQRIPNELKFDLNCLLFTHGKLCQKCTKKGSNREGKNGCYDSCPLLEYCKTGLSKQVNPCTKSEKLIVESEEENRRKLFDRVSSEVARSRERTAVHELENKKHKCPICLKETRNLQALGDHQNAHKERVKK